MTQKLSVVSADYTLDWRTQTVDILMQGASLRWTYRHWKRVHWKRTSSAPLMVSPAPPRVRCMVLKKSHQPVPAHGPWRHVSLCSENGIQTSWMGLAPSLIFIWIMICWWLPLLVQLAYMQICGLTAFKKSVFGVYIYLQKHICKHICINTFA